MTKQEQQTEELRCISCGSIVQAEDPNGLGCTPKSAPERGEETGGLYCQRCFRLRHYNEVAPVSLTGDDFLRLLNQIRDANVLIMYVVNVFDFNGSLVPDLHRFVGGSPVLLVGNKGDLLPRSLRRPKLTDWIRQQASIARLCPIGTVLVSAKKNHQINHLLDVTEEYRHNRDVYVIGVINIRKSTLINQIIEQRAGVKELITTSRFPGTTLDKTEIPLDDGHILVDTPGIIHQEQMAHVLSPKDLKIVASQREIKPKTYQLNDGQTLFLDGVVRFDYLHSERAGMIAYSDSNLPVHRTKLSNVDSFCAKHLRDLLTPPAGDEKDGFPSLERCELHITERSDVVFEGLKWITAPAETTVTAWVLKGVGALVRRTII